MAAKVSFRSMDYFKYRKYVIDNDDPSSCSKEVTSLCACVQTLNMRDDMFDEGGGEWGRFEEVFASYKQILAFKRVETVDVRLKSGWWGDQKSGLSVGKVKPAMLKDVLISKCKDWHGRHGDSKDDVNLEKAIEGSGVYVFKHKEKGCFQQVFNCCDNIFVRCAELFKCTFDATTYTPLSSLLVVSLVHDWDFYFIPAESNAELLKVLENDTILKHDTLWPHGLNLLLSIETPFDVKQFRESCVRHNWPPERVCRPSKVLAMDPGRLKLDPKRLKSQPPTLRSPVKPASSPNSPPGRPSSARPNSTGNSIGIPSTTTLKSPQSSRPSTAHSRPQKPDEKPTNGVSRKEDVKKQSRASPKQEANSIKDKRTSRSFQSFKKESSFNDIQAINKNEGSPSVSEKHGASSEQRVVTPGIKKEENEGNFDPQKLENNNKDDSQKYVDKKDDTEKDDDDFFELKPLKRSGTFTLSDTEEDKPTPTTKESNLTSRAVMAAKQISSN